MRCSWCGKEVKSTNKVVDTYEGISNVCDDCLDGLNFEKKADGMIVLHSCRVCGSNTDFLVNGKCSLCMQLDLYKEAKKKKDIAELIECGVAESVVNSDNNVDINNNFSEHEEAVINKKEYQYIDDDELEQDSGDSYLGEISDEEFEKLLTFSIETSDESKQIKYERFIKSRLDRRLWIIAKLMVCGYNIYDVKFINKYMADLDKLALDHAKEIFNGKVDILLLKDGETPDRDKEVIAKVRNTYLIKA